MLLSFQRRVRRTRVRVSSCWVGGIVEEAGLIQSAAEQFRSCSDQARNKSTADGQSLNIWFFRLEPIWIIQTKGSREVAHTSHVRYAPKAEVGYVVLEGRAKRPGQIMKWEQSSTESQLKH